MNYFLRKIIKHCPGYIMNAITKPEPTVTEGFHSRNQVGEICRNAGYQNVLLVTDATLYGLRYHAAVLESLQAAGIICSVFSDIRTEPTIPVVDQGIAAARACRADCIIALGGGSVLDSSKVIAAGAPLKRRSAASLLHYFHFRKTLPIIAIPSTAGTGAETTIAAMVQNAKDAKCPTVFTHLNITNVILDSELTVKIPSGITAACGIATESDAPEVAADKLMAAIGELMEKCNLSTRIEIPESDCQSLIRMIEADSISYTPPVVMRAREIREVLVKWVNGEMDMKIL